MMYRKILFPSFFAVLVMVSGGLCAQTHYSKSKMENEPVWIKMIQSDEVNFFEAETAFKLYFSKHAMPTMEEEEMGKNDNLKQRSIAGNEKFLAKKHRTAKKKKQEYAEPANDAQMAFEVKKFKHWEMLTRPYVKEDGSIMTTEEREKIWRGSRQ